MKKFLLLLLLPLLLLAEDYIFAISWEESFCQLHPERSECRKNYDYFTIHGLWPKKERCRGVQNFRLPNQLWQELKFYMPSTKLIKHEWRKHGVCYSREPEIYFRDSLKLIKEINSSPIREFFLKHRGRIVTKEQLNRVINRNYPHTARKVKMICDRGYLVELRFSLKGEIESEDLYSLLKKGKNLKGSCQKGKIAK